MPSKPHIYDKTQARRQAKRRALFNQMRDALRKVEAAATLDEAKAAAQAGLQEDAPEKYVE